MEIKIKISPLSQDDQPLMRVINELGNTVYHFGLNDFIQVNEGINNLILKTISSICGPSGNRLIDFFLWNWQYRACACTAI